MLGLFSDRLVAAARFFPARVYELFLRSFLHIAGTSNFNGFVICSFHATPNLKLDVEAHCRTAISSVRSAQIISPHVFTRVYVQQISMLSI